MNRPHLRILCPFHQEQTPSLLVDTTNKRWHCLGCGKGSREGLGELNAALVDAGRQPVGSA